MVVLVVMAGLASLAAAAETGTAPGAAPPAESSDVSKVIGLAFAAAFVAAVSIASAGYAVARVGSAALGAVAEKPELMGRSLVFVALAEGLAVLGFALAVIMLFAT
jgi:V/A-type H+-transporting ATPase subunit K